MKLSVCVSAVYSGKDIVEGMRLAKEAGYDIVEFWTWWDKDLSCIKKAKEELNMTISTFCTKFVSLTDSTKRGEYIKGLEESIAAAKELSCSKLISQVGNDIEGVSRDVQHKSIVDGLKQCAPILEREGITLLVEPLNLTVDHKGYYLYSSDEAFEIIDEVGSPNVKILFDIYHQQIMEGHLISRINRNIDKIGHFHAAGNPGRHELTIGEINYPEIIKAIDATGFDGCTGLEYFPIGDPSESLKELRRMGL
jgi:hydroxypyruvate isomerase